MCHLDASKKGADRELQLVECAQRMTNLLLESGPFDLVYERYSLWSSVGMDFARQSHIPSVLEVNAPLLEEQARYRELFNRELAYLISNRAFVNADVISCVSNEVLKHIVENFQICNTKLLVNPNGVDVTRFTPLQISRDVDAFRVGFVGSLKPWHGVEYLLDAFGLVLREYRNAKLVIVGDGPERAKLSDRFLHSHAYSEDCVEWLGSLSPEQVIHQLNTLDVAVAPYPDLSNFYFSPLKVYEYMACGLPVIASRVGQLRSIITHRIDGFLCKPACAWSLARQISWLAEHPNIRRQIGVRARQKAENEFSWDQVLERALAAVSSTTDISELDILDLPAKVRF